jgi:hypothetical protein
VIGAARLVTLLAEVTGALGEALNALQDAALQPLRKALARILDPLRDLLASLEALIDKVRLAAARGESGRIEMSSEELARRIRGPTPRTSAPARPAPIRGGAGVDDDATEIFEPEAQKKLIAEAQARASLREDWPEIDAPEEPWAGLDPQDAPTEELSAEASARLRLEARERAGAQPAGSETTPNADEAAAAEDTDRPGRNWKQFAPEGESTPPSAYNVKDKSFGPAASGQDGNAERWLKRPDYKDTPAAPGEHEIGVASEPPGEVRSQPGEMVEADVPDTELREVLSREPLARSYGIEKPPPTEYNELIESAGTTRRAEVEPSAWDAAHPGETRGKEFGGGDAGREPGFSKYEDGPDASAERTSGQTLVPDEQLEVPDPAMRGPNDPDQIRLEQEEREAWDADWGMPRDVPRERAGLAPEPASAAEAQRPAAESVPAQGPDDPDQVRLQQEESEAWSEDWPTSKDQPPSKNPPKHRRIWFKGKRRKA